MVGRGPDCRKDLKDLILKVSEKYTQEKVVKVVRWMVDNGELNIDNWYDYSSVSWYELWENVPKA